MVLVQCLPNGRISIGNDIGKPCGSRIEECDCICYPDIMNINGSISHDRQDETPEAKARWFRSLPMSERMEMLCSFTDLALTVTPSLLKGKHAQPVAGRIQIISAA